MTTIAFKDNTIAYDTRCTSQNHILDDSYDKKDDMGNVVFFLAGEVADKEDFIADALTGTKGQREYNVSGIAYDKGSKALYSIYQGEDFIIRRYSIGDRESYSIGSGGQYALAAMDLGKTAKEAVRYAMKRDACTGGRVREYKLK